MCTPFFILSVTAQFLFNDYYFYRPTLSKRLVLHGTSCWSVRLSLPKRTPESSTHQSWYYQTMRQRTQRLQTEEGLHTLRTFTVPSVYRLRGYIKLDTTTLVSSKYRYITLYIIQIYYIVLYIIMVVSSLIQTISVETLQKKKSKN